MSCTLPFVASPNATGTRFSSAEMAGSFFNPNFLSVRKADKTAGFDSGYEDCGTSPSCNCMYSVDLFSN